MIILKRIIFRLLILTILVVGLGTARNVIVRTGISVYAKSQFQIPLEIKSVRFEPMQGSLHLQGITLPQIASFESDKISVTIDSFSAAMNMEKFMRRYFHFEQIELHGICCEIKGTDDSDRSDFFVPKEIWNRFQSRFPDWVTQDDTLTQKSLQQSLVPLLIGDFDKDSLKQLEQQFESSKFSQEISQRWSEELQPILQRTREISQRIERIQNVIKNPKQFSQNGSPQATLTAVQEIFHDAESLENDLRDIISRKDSLKDFAKHEALTLKQHLKNDFNKIRELRPPQIDAQQIAEVFLSDEIQQQLASILAWIDSLGIVAEQDLMQKDAMSFFPGRLPGHFSVFESRKNQADILAKRIECDGELKIGNQPVYFLARIHDAVMPSDSPAETMTMQLCLDFAPMKCTTPEERDAVFSEAPFTGDVKQIAMSSESLFNEPVDSPRLQVGPGDMIPGLPGSRIYVTAIWDTDSDIEESNVTKNQPVRQRYYIACPGFQLPERTLGEKGDFSLTVSPGMSQFYAMIEHVAGEFQGRVRLTQYPIRLTPHLPDKLQHHPEKRAQIDFLLAELVRGIDVIDMELSFVGTKDHPRFQLKSDFAQRFATNFEGTLARNWNMVRQNIANELNDQTNQTLRHLGSMFNEQLDPALNRLLAAQTQIVGGNGNITVQQIVQSLLGGSPQLSLPSQQYASQAFDNAVHQGGQILKNAIENSMQQNSVEQSNTYQQNHVTIPLKTFEQELKKGFQENFNMLLQRQ